MHHRASQEGSRLLTVKEAAEYLRLSVGGLYHLISQRRVPVIRLSRRSIRFRLADLETWLSQRTEPAREVEHK